MHIELQEHSDHLTVFLPPIHSLLSDEGQVLVEDLLGVAENALSPGFGKKFVCLILTGASTDRNPKWFDDLSKNLLLAETYNRIMNLRWLLSLIRKSPVPWMFLAADDCLGTAWELALSCSRRYWFSSSSLVGFPEITVGGFPAGGVVESLVKTDLKFKEFWQRHPIVSAQTAFEQGYIHFVSAVGPNWRDTYAETISLRGFYESSAAASPSETRKFSRTDIDDSFGEETKEVVLEQLETARAKVRSIGPAAGDIWDYCWGLIKQRNKLKDSRELGRLIAILAARFYHSRRYQHFIYASFVKNSAETLPKADFGVGRIAIDLNYLVPPTPILIALIRSSTKVIFFADEAKALAVALNMIFNRLERAIGANVVKTFWQENVAWFCGAADRSKMPIVHWSADDRVTVESVDGKFEFLRLEGNASTAPMGIMEAVTPIGSLSKDNPLSDVVSMIATGLFENPFKTSRLPLSLFIRSSFFQEMLRIAKYATNDVQIVVENLKAQGWGFAGDDEAWHRFLSSRTDIYTFDNKYEDIGFVSLSQSDWGIGSFKHARAISKKGAIKSDYRWSSTQVSQHLATFLGSLVLDLCHGVSQSSVNVVDHIASVSVGFPVGMGTPVGYLYERGYLRVSHYCEAHWPKMDTEKILARIKQDHDVL